MALNLTRVNVNVSPPLPIFSYFENHSHEQDVDRRASKGRKLRYTAHPKLENFMAPEPRDDPELDCDELYRTMLA